MTASPRREVDANLLSGAAPRSAQPRAEPQDAGGQDPGDLVEALGGVMRLGWRGVAIVRRQGILLDTCYLPAVGRNRRARPAYGAEGLALSRKSRYLSQPPVHRRGRPLHFRRSSWIAARVSTPVVTASQYLVRPTRAASPLAPGWRTLAATRERRALPNGHSCAATLRGDRSAQDDEPVLPAGAAPTPCCLP